MSATKANDVGAQVFFFSTMAVGLSYQNMPEASAFEYVEQAFNLAKAHPEVGEPFIANQAYVILQVQTGNKIEANARIQALLAKPGLTLAERVNYLSAAGYVALSLKNDKAGIEYYRRAIELGRMAGATREVADMQAAISGIYLKKNDLMEAERFARNAVFGLEQAGALPLLPARLDALAQVLIAQKKYAEAGRVYNRAEAVQDSLIGRGDSLLSKTAAITGADQLYANHVAFVAKMFNDAEAGYRIVEHGRARALVELLLAKNVPQERSIEIENEIARLRIEMASLRTPDAIDKKKQAIFLAEEARSSISDLPSAVGSHPFTPISAKRVRACLGKSEVLLEFMLGNPRSFVFELTQHSINIVPLASRDLIESAVEGYLAAVRRHADADSQATKLYAVLLGPIRDIADYSGYTIIPDGVLNRLPFDALHDGKEYVVQRHIVTYYPSSAALYLLRNAQPRASPRSNALMAVGEVPYEVHHDEMKLTNIERDYSTVGSFTNLASSGPEIDLALESLPNRENRRITGQSATETYVKQSLNKGFGYVHLAVHAYANEDPNKAAIVVLGDPRQGEDGFIQAAEIARQRIDAKLVVLSACDTAVGPVEGQEGASALSTAFIIAGSRTGVSTLWNVEDQASLSLMRRFYQHLGHGESAADSLANAKRELLKMYGSHSLPVYWAGFVVQGSEPGVN